jgi:hypothetical protein
MTGIFRLGMSEKKGGGFPSLNLNQFLTSLYVANRDWAPLLCKVKLIAVYKVFIGLNQ